jgi:UDP-N-acetylglucosamine transferase subunit ALG13
MILLTVGTQLPFDRLVELVDRLAIKHQIQVKAQIGKSGYQSRQMEIQSFFTPDEMERAFKEASVVISHAGMGSIINCLRFKKPMIIYPRMAKYGEHRNDHQLDTLESFSNIQGIYPAKNEDEFERFIFNIDKLKSPLGLYTPERDSLISYIREKIG